MSNYMAETKTQTAIAPLKPFVKWAGGKTQLIPEIENIFFSERERTFTKYAEPMAGGGALLFSLLGKYNFENVYISDTNAELINAYNTIKHDVRGLTDILEKMQSEYLSAGEDGRKLCYYACRDKFNGLQLCPQNSAEKAALFIFLNKTCFNGLYRVNRQGQYNVPMGSYKNPVICDKNNLMNISAALQDVEIECGDYTLSESFIDKDTFVYIDPPYRPISKTSAFTSYNATNFDDNEQVRLAEFTDRISAKGAKFVLSNSDPKNTDTDDNFFDKLYAKYTINRVPAARFINSKGGGRGKITELIIHN